MFFYIVLTPISTTSSLRRTGNKRKYHQIDVYIYQCDVTNDDDDGDDYDHDINDNRDMNSLCLATQKEILQVQYRNVWKYLGLVTRKPVFEVSDKARLKPVFSATETSWNIEISLDASLDMILSSK